MCVLGAHSSLADARIVSASPVPASVQRAIARQVPLHLRYLPSEVPGGYVYESWHGGSSGLDIYFAPDGRPPTVGFHVASSGAAGACKQGGTHYTYRFGSVRVSFENDRYSEQYWRCVQGDRVSLDVTSRPADAATAPRRRAIAAMVASATQLL